MIGECLPKTAREAVRGDAVMQSGKQCQAKQAKVALRHPYTVVGANNAGEMVATSEQVEGVVFAAIMPHARVNEGIAV